MSADDWSDEIDEAEYPEEDEWGDDTAETVPCPACGDEIYEEAVRCPRCGTYISANTSVWSERSWWWVTLGLLGILAVVLALVWR